MWISRYKWERLVERVEKLEDAPKPFLYIWNGWRFDPVPAGDVLQTLLDKLGLSLEKQSKQEALVLIDKNAADPK